MLLAFAAGCAGASGPAEATDASHPGIDGGDEAPDGGGVPHLTPAHPGWKKPRCLSCHDNQRAPLPHDPSAYVPPDCVGCHGFNGARHRDHAGDPAGNCAECHGQGALMPDHLGDFDLPRECSVCHVHPSSPEGL